MWQMMNSKTNKEDVYLHLYLYVMHSTQYNSISPTALEPGTP